MIGLHIYKEHDYLSLTSRPAFGDTMIPLRCTDRQLLEGPDQLRVARLAGRARSNRCMCNPSG